ncbi:DUF3238 domain-containing protein [Cytobacillus sp. S13-E01]|uniref:DUF3238 domain-containing protein n=1 Tax=Cytobacillus sp. S13-E01 TaxID=3031326 RepID=UPI0023D85CDD|nr:DUF3238 domain-containing protein [Cytobacillus sp. S13-E01]MDF0725777.1 DUF3238 domain-containing protein [Cytobacillus sp. S13-E01]
MAVLELRLKTFIPQSRILFSESPSLTVYFGGDGRSESWDGTYRTYQKFTIDTAPTDYSVSYYEDTGTTNKYTYDSLGKLISTETGKAPVTDLSYTKRVSGGYLYLDCVVASNNPLVAGSPDIDYQFTIRVNRSGGVLLTGNHDGFPAYELWRKKSGSSAELIWSHDPRDTGEGIGSLFPPMEHPVNVSKA